MLPIWKGWMEMGCNQRGESRILIADQTDSDDNLENDFQNTDIGPLKQG
jgi:hypothetical protein